LSKRALPLVILFAVICTSALIFGGCGGKTQDPKETLAQAARGAREAGSVHAQINVILAPLEGESGLGVNVQGDAWLDMNGKALEARFTVMGMELSLRYVDGKAYLQMGGKWYVLTGEVIAGIGEGVIGALVNVLVTYPELFSSTAEVSELGDKKVGDYQCTNLKVVPDLQAIAALGPVQKLAGELDMTADEIEGYLQGTDLKMEACLQKKEPVIREVYLAANVELPQMGEVAGIPLLPTKAHMEAQIDFPEYGMMVEVQPPPNPAPFKGL